MMIDDLTEENIDNYIVQKNKEKQEEVSEMLHNRFPDFLKEFLNSFVKTKFYKKAYEKARSYADEFNFKIDDYFLVDWECLISNVNEKNIIDGLLKRSQYGLIPHYQYDELKVIVLDFEHKEAHLEQGYAVQPYASYVLKHRREIPKYMQPLIDKLWKDYDEYMKDKECKK